MSDATTDPINNDFTERFWRLIERGLGCRVPLYIKNILKLRGFDNAASIKTLSNEDYAAVEKFARTKMEKFIPKSANRADYFHLFSDEPQEFEILPGHIRLLNEIVNYITVTTASHDLTFFDPDLQFRNADNSIEKSQELFKSDEKLNCELANSVDHAVGRSLQLINTNGKKGYESANSVNNSNGRCHDLFMSNEKLERQFGVLKPLGLSQDLFRSNMKVHELGYSDHNILRRSKSNDIELGRKKFINLEQREIIKALLQNSTNLDSYRSGENCIVSHVNSISDFYIQMESDVNALDQLANFLLNAPRFDELTDINDGIVCAAKCIEDGLWYRAMIKSFTADNAKVFFIDCGNSSLTNELRIIPSEISTAPSLAKHCSMVKPKEILCWSANAEERFLELCDNDTNFMVEVISHTSEKSIVNLFVNQKSFLEEISGLSAKHSPRSSNSSLQSKSDNFVASETIQLDKDINEKKKTVIETKVCSKTVAVDESENVVDETKTFSTATILEEKKQGEFHHREQASTSPSDGGSVIVSLPAVCEALTQYSKLPINGEGMLTQPKDIPYKVPKFIEPLQLIDGDIVVIRYVESPSAFYVQKTKNIPFYNDMMDKLMQHCLSAPALKTFEIGMACAARYDSEWYRAQIEEVRGEDVLIRFVDFGYVLTTETNNLKEISNDCMYYTKQAVRCCLLGFDALQGSCSSTIDRMELLAENSLAERRNFRVKIHGHVNDSVLVNLIDESESPPLDISKRMLQLSLPLDAYRSYERKVVKQAKTSQEPINGAGHPSDSEIQDAVTSSTPHCKPANSSGSKFCKNEDNLNKSHGSRNETLSPEDVIDPNTQIPFEEISFNNSEEVKLSWCLSPLEFYVSTTKHEADFINHMKTIHHFYKNKSPAPNKINIGSYVIAKYRIDNQFHRAEIVDYNEELNKYKARFIDVGVLTILDVSDIYEMDKRFAKFERRAILCSLRGVALRASRFDMESAVEKYFTNKNLKCKFIKRKGDTFFVDIEADGMDVKEALIRDEFLSVLSEEIEIERLVGQTVLAKVVSIKNWSSLQVVISGCETIFEASCKDFKLYSESKQLEDLPMQKTIPIRVVSLLAGQTFSVIPLIYNFGAPPSSPICKLPFFSNNFKVLVTYWETHNIAYVQSVSADNFEQSVLTQLFEYYNSNGDGLQEFVPETLCAVKSSDENWYRAEIISVSETEVTVRYLDYGNYEIIPKKLVKRLESQFYETPALAIKVYLPLKEAQDDKEKSVCEIDALTSHTPLDLTILDYYAQNWIVDMFQDGDSIISFIKTTTGCDTLPIDELKEQMDNITLSRNVTPPLLITQNDHQDETQSKVKLIDTEHASISQKMQLDCSNTSKTEDKTQSKVKLIDAELPTISQKMQLDCSNTSKTKAYISHVDRPDHFYLQVLSESDELELDLLQENIQMAAPMLPQLEDFSVGTRCIVQYDVDGQWYRGVIIHSDLKITSVLFIDYGNTDTITDNSLIKLMNETFDDIPAYAIPCALPIEAKENEWSEESCELLKNLVYEKVEFEYVCKGKDNNFVQIYHDDRDIMEELIQKGYAIKLETIKSGENCYVSHVNSISDFYIQMESDTDELEKLAGYFLDASKFEVLTDIINGLVCVAKFLGDGLWYRAIIKSHTADKTEVFFMDYGNTSFTNEVCIIPPEIANIPALAKHCSIVKPEDIHIWSENAEDRFVELTINEAIFMVDVITPGKKSIIDLFVNEKSILEEISNLCNKDSLKTSKSSLRSYILPSDTIKALIVDGTPELFYIQLERNLNELHQIWELLEQAATWPILDQPVFGQMCAAIFEGMYYRARIVSVNKEGATVHYIDYGNKSISTDLRVLPENLQISEPLAIKCSLESKNGIYSPQLVERFEKLSRDDLLEIKYVSENSSPAIIQLFENGALFADISNTEPTQNDHVKADFNNSFVKEIINEAIELAESRYFAN